MKAQRSSRFLVLSLVILITGFTVALAGRLQQDDGVEVGRLVLQKDELPEAAEAYHVRQLTSESFPGETPLNLLVQGKGFGEGRIVEAWHPLLTPQEARGDTTKGQAVAYVLNIAAGYQNEADATATLKQIQEAFRSQLPADMFVAVDVIEEYDESSRGTDDVRKRYVIRLAYREDGHTLDIYYSFRVRGDALIVLVVNGPGGPATREVFDAVTETLQQH